MDINTKEELLKYMDSIEYGFVDGHNVTHTPSDLNFNSAFRTTWQLSSPVRLSKVKYGNCFDQVEFERAWFEAYGYNVKTFYIYFALPYTNEFVVHTYLLFEEKNKWCYFEHADEENMGIYEFDTLEDAIDYQKQLYIRKNSNIKDLSFEELDNLKVVEYTKPPYGSYFNEFIDYVLDNGIEFKEKYKQPIKGSAE